LEAIEGTPWMGTVGDTRRCVGGSGATRGRKRFRSGFCNPNLVIPCRRIKKYIMMDFIRLRLGAEYIGIHNLEGK